MRTRESLYWNSSLLFRRLHTMVRQPIFILMTLAGNTFVLAGAYSLYWLERGINPKIVRFMDALWWAVTTVTTVGYGDIIPVTDAGKFIGMAMMILGSALFWSFPAIFAAVLLAPAITHVEARVRGLEKGIQSLEKEVKDDERNLEQTIGELERTLSALKSLIKK
jgi:voltage-gated potassium channel